MDGDIKYFERIPSKGELEDLAGEEFIIKLREIPDASESDRLEGVFNAHLFFELPFVPDDDEFELFRSIPHTIEGVDVFLDHQLTDGELRQLIRMQRFVENYNLHVHLLMTYVPGYEERKRVKGLRSAPLSFLPMLSYLGEEEREIMKGLRFPPHYNFLLSHVPNFEVRGDLLKIQPPPNVLLLLDHVPREDEMVEFRRVRPIPLLGIILDHFPGEGEYLRLRDEVGPLNTIVYLNLGRDLKSDEIEYMKYSGVPFTTVADRDEAVLDLLSR